MRRLVLAFALATCFALVAPDADAALRYLVIDGTTGAIVRTDIAGAPPAVARLGTGFYRIRFGFNVLVFAGHAQRPGIAGDATGLIFTSSYHPTNPREIHVTTLGVAASSPVLTRMDGRITIIVNQ